MSRLTRRKVERALEQAKENTAMGAGAAPEDVETKALDIDLSRFDLPDQARSYAEDSVQKDHPAAVLVADLPEPDVGDEGEEGNDDAEV